MLKGSGFKPQWMQGLAALDVAHRDVPLSFTILFSHRLRIDVQQVAAALRNFHPRMASAEVHLDNRMAPDALLTGRASWRKHVIEFKGFDSKMNAEDLECCLMPSHFGDLSYKDSVRAHQSHVVLSYTGDSTSTLNQYVALAAFACCLYEQGAITVVNELAHTCFPADALALGIAKGDRLTLLGTLPLPLLYCGFVKYEIEDEPGVWMRTFGAHVFGWPDFAVHADSHDQSEFFCDLFASIWIYLRESGAQLAIGQTMDYGRIIATLTAPSDEDYFLASPGELFVLEIED
jgi:hypothetical protein